MTLLFLALTGILFLLAARFYSNTWSRGVRIGVEFGQESIRVGEQTELVETVENHKRMPVAAMEVAFRVPKGLLFLDAENTVISDYVYKRDVFSMRGMEKIYRTYHLTGTQRDSTASAIFPASHPVCFSRVSFSRTSRTRSRRCMSIRQNPTYPGFFARPRCCRARSRACAGCTRILLPFHRSASIRRRIP